MIKEKLKIYTLTVWTRKGKLHLLPLTIPEHTINNFVSKIKSQCIFSLYSTMANKTESRSVAEWSLRSTIAYAAVAACNHFIPLTQLTPFHPRKKDINKEEVILWNLVERYYNNMVGNTHNPTKMAPVLPNLVTSTDKVTIFATAGEIFKKDKFYLVTKPEEIKNEASHSGSRNHYKKKLTGDAHCRGVRMVINSTFTAGGVSAPIFVAIYGLSSTEMPGDSIITIEVPGLVAGSQSNLYSHGSGYVCFVRGIKEPCAVINEDNDIPVTNDLSTGMDASTNVMALSKESLVDELYRKKVYYPFIKKIRKEKYNFDDTTGNAIPEYLWAISWMDGCSSQLKLITSESNMQVENKLKITVCKHSAARTSVEQAADAGPMFKELKRLNNNTKSPHTCNSSVFHFLQTAIDSLENENNSSSVNGRRLNLPSHKKKAIIATTSKLPIATSHAYTDAHIKKAFVLNGQLDISHNLVPSLNGLLNTYRGDIEGTCLTDKESLIEGMYSEVFTDGIGSESI